MKSASDKILVYLMRHPSGVSSGQIDAWLESCKVGGGYTYQEMCAAKRALRDAGRITCTNKIWWLKYIPSTQKEAIDVNRTIAKRRAESRAGKIG